MHPQRFKVTRDLYERPPATTVTKRAASRALKASISKSLSEAGDAVTPSTRARKKRANKSKHTPDASRRDAAEDMAATVAASEARRVEETRELAAQTAAEWIAAQPDAKLI